ncbi:MAG: hypothetical protein AAF515_05575 [Pseudomonadota bacterium]
MSRPPINPTGPPPCALGRRSAAAVFGAAVLGLIGACGTVGPGTATGTDDSDAQSEEAWLCEPDSRYDDWDCERGEDLQPTRPPPPARPDVGLQLDEESLSAPIDRNEIADAASPSRERRSGPAGPAAFAPEMPAAAQAVKTSVAPAPSLPADVPEYIALAYTPPTPTRIIDLPGEFIAAQLIAVASKDRIQGVVDEFGMRGVAAARIESDGRLLYVLLAGIYETRDIAQRAIANLPETFEAFSPWLRPLGGLQAAMRRADELAGGSDI